MPQRIASLHRRIKLEPLTQATFAPFGAVIDNPNKSSRPNLERKIANQGTCQRWFDITHLTDFYHSAPSGKPSSPSMSFAICEPRKVRILPSADSQQPLGVSGAGLDAMPSLSVEPVYDIEILERHPYTSQTFIPMGLSACDSSTHYIVIVAPTLPLSQPSDRQEVLNRPKPYPTPDPPARGIKREVFARNRAEPYTNGRQPPTAQSLGASVGSHESPKGPGLPDLNNIRAFLARGDQAVTYAAGAWHAPMAVIGENSIEFVVVQNVNGVAAEDCQEVELQSEQQGEGLAVSLSLVFSSSQALKAKL